MKWFVNNNKSLVSTIAAGMIFFFSSVASAEESSGAITSMKESGAKNASATEFNLAQSHDKTSEPLTASGVAGQTTPLRSPQAASTGSAMQLVNLLGGLLLIVGLILGLSWFVKRFGQGGFIHNPTIRIVSAMPLGTRERVMLIDVGGKQILLGVTAMQVSRLHVFDEPVTKEPEKRKEEPGADFSQKLMKILQQKNGVLPIDPQKNNRQ